jgi:hypothetical protein
VNLHIEIGGENKPTLCECCGNETKTIWGYIYDGDNAVSAYFVQWTCNKKEHSPNFDFLIGTWGDDFINDKKLISFIYNPTNEDGGEFMVIDSSERPAANSALCTVALSREEVINDGDIMGSVTDMIDAIWLGDPRIEEIKNFGKNA